MAETEGVTKSALEPANVTPAAEFLNACWRAAYAGILDAGFLSSLTTQTRVDILEKRLHTGMKGVLAHDLGGAIVGLAAFGPAHLVLLGDAGEVSMLYVRPDRIGTGLGHELLVDAESQLVSDGFTRIGLDAFTDNVRAIRFYLAHGYRKIGTKIDHIEGHEYQLDVMMKDLTS